MKCPLCKKSTSQKPLMVYKGYKLYQCKSCTNGFWHPLKMPSGDWYANAENEENEALSYTYSTLHSTEHFITPQHKNFFKKIPVNSGKLLDVGCGNGSFIKEASKRFLTYGIDFDPKCIDAANRRGLKNVVLANISDYANRNNKSFDVVTFFEVLEHQSNPDAFISSVKKLLKRGGYIAGSVPLHKEIKPFGEGDVPPNHFLMFTKEGLKKYLRLKGFKNIVAEEIVTIENVRSSLGINSTTLRTFFGISKEYKRNSFKHLLYVNAKNIARLMLPLINVFVSIYLALIGYKKKKDIENGVTGGFYFQAKL